MSDLPAILLPGTFAAPGTAAGEALRAATGVGVAGPDTLAATARTINGWAAESLPAVSGALPTGADPAPLTAADMFGEASVLAEQSDWGSSYFDWILTGTVFFSLAVLMCFAGLCLLVYYFRSHMSTVANIFRGTLYIEKVMDEHNFIFETFRRLLIVAGLMVTGLVAVRYCDRSWGGQIAERLDGWAVFIPVPAVWLALGAVWLVQNFMLRAAGWLTYGTAFTRDLISLRNLGYGLLFLFSLPVMLLVVLSGYGSAAVLSWVLATVVTALLIFIVIRTYLLFIRQNISILYWFLYLCAVEILPVSFLVVLAVRGIG